MNTRDCLCTSDDLNKKRDKWHRVTRAVRVPYVFIDRGRNSLPKRHGVWSEIFLLPQCAPFAAKENSSTARRGHSRSRMTRDHASLRPPIERRNSPNLEKTAWRCHPFPDRRHFHSGLCSTTTILRLTMKHLKTIGSFENDWWSWRS